MDGYPAYISSNKASDICTTKRTVIKLILQGYVNNYYVSKAAVDYIF